ncbi:CHASE domain-containing protein [Rufibacter sediminis]|uniref:histidine kinase n=1 Tax=Rufibacter sediminis TaxID=2762756 RepID=A0ABR6VVL1_9BACT|nr:CHASE domain-containing protein [Rufibacter sediminis]MBC3540848.1 CHASE domain-containing protein [Rufibacter sediminis]
MIFSRLKDYYLAFGSFVLVLGMTLYAFYVSRTNDQLEDAQSFKIRQVQVKATLERRMGYYLQILHGVNGLFVASDTVTRADFQSYLSSLQIIKNYPGVQGIGFAVMSTPEQVPQLEERVRAEGFPNFKVWPEGPRTEYSSIVFIEPMNALNKRAFGFDMFQDPTRREAMEAARDFNLPAMTGKVKLVQEGGDNVQPGLLIYMPVYYRGKDPVDLMERRNRLRGFVYAPFRANDLFFNTIGDEFNDISISIYDGKAVKEEALLYRNAAQIDPSENTDSLLLATDVIRVAGRTWTLRYKATRSFREASGIDQHDLILLGGSIISLLIFFVVWSLQRYLLSNQLTELITKNTTAGLFMLDDRGYCSFQNPAAEKLLGFSLEELKSRPLYELVHRGQEPGNLAPELVSQKSFTFEDIFLCRDGNQIPVMCSTRFVKQRGEVVGHILEVRDVTEEKKAQQALLESEARFRIMADSAPVMIWITDEDNNCTYVNRQWLKFTGSTLEENMDKKWLQFMHPEDVDKAMHSYSHAFHVKSEFKVEYRLRRHDGEYRGMVTMGIPRFSAEGEFMGYIGSTIDISDRIKMEQRLKDSADTLQKIFMQVPAIVGLVQVKDLQYTLVNPYLSQLYGGEARVGESVTASLQASRREGFKAVIQRIAQTGEPYIGQEVPIAFDNPEEEGGETVRFFNMVYEPIRNSRGEVESVLTFAVEVTEQVKSREQLSVINDELNQKNQELIRINNDLDNFVYTASHDLRSPLANLEGLTTALLETVEGKEEGEEHILLQMVASSIAKLKGTIHDLTEITKVQKDLESQAEVLTFAEVLAGVEEDIAPLIHEAEVQLQTSFDVKQVRFARKNLRSILYNLVSNAVKYRDPVRKLTVTINTFRQGEYVVLTVQDNGLGIREDQQEKLFTMFRRFHSHVEGTGIGLYIVKRIIENNGGYIEVSSRQGLGSTFTVYFREMGH